MCHSIVMCKTCNKCQKCCLKSACRGEISKLLVNLAESGCRSESSSNPERGLHHPLSDPAKTPKVSNHHKLLCQSPQEPLPAGGITSAYRQELVDNQRSLGFFNRLFLVPKPNSKRRSILVLSKLNLFLKAEKFKKETPETIRISLQQGEWVTSITFKNAYLHIPIQEQSRKYLRFQVQGLDIPVQGTAIQFVHSTHGVYCNSKRGETDGHTQGYKNPPVPRRLVGESQIPPGLSPAYSRSSENIPRARLAGEFRKKNWNPIRSSILLR